MQIRNWTNLKFLLAVKRGKTLAKAAALLSVNATTVSRRIEDLETALGVHLIERRGDGIYELSEEGLRVAREAEAIEQHVDTIARQSVQRHEAVSGTVRLTSVPVVINRALVPALGSLHCMFPGLALEILADVRDYSLTKRDADLAIRLSRPRLGGSHLKARRITTWTYKPFMSSSFSMQENTERPLITFDETMSFLPQAVWMSQASRGHPGGLSPFRVHDTETALEAAAAGVGIALLPEAVASKDNRLAEVELPDCPEELHRELWLVGHTDQLSLPRIKGVCTWLEQVFCNPRNA